MNSYNLQDYLIDKTLFEDEFRKFHPEDSYLDAKLDCLESLMKRNSSCELVLSKETRVEQSFNEQIFGNLLGYKSILMSNGEPYHLEPKTYVGGNKRYNDFSLGVIEPTKKTLLVSAELKDPFADLFAPQGGNYNGQTPVQQALQTAQGHPSIVWVLVSNFVEILVFHVGTQSNYMKFDLLSMNKRREMKRMLFVLELGSFYTSELSQKGRLQKVLTKAT